MTEVLVGQRQRRALIKALDPFDQFKSSAAHLVVIMAFELVALLLPSAGNACFHGDEDEVVKLTIMSAIPMVTTYRSYSVVTIIDIRSDIMTMAILHDQHPGHLRGQQPP